MAEDGSRTYRPGVRRAVSPDAALELEVVRSESAGDGPEHKAGPRPV